MDPHYSARLGRGSARLGARAMTDHDGDGVRDADLESDCDSFPGDLSQLADLVDLGDSDDPHGGAGPGGGGGHHAAGAAPAAASAYGASYGATYGAGMTASATPACAAPRRKAVSFHSNTGVPPSKKMTTGTAGGLTGVSA